MSLQVVYVPVKATLFGLSHLLISTSCNLIIKKCCLVSIYLPASQSDETAATCKQTS